MFHRLLPSRLYLTSKPGPLSRISGAASFLVAILAAATLSACTGGEDRAADSGHPIAAPDPIRVGPYAIGEGTLYRARGEELVPLAALPGGGVAADTLEECAGAIPELGSSRFGALTLSPDPDWAAWETTGLGACIGVVGPTDPPARVLGVWSAAIPDSLIWAPVGRFLAVWWIHPAQRRSLWVFDAVSSARLEMPWDMDCIYEEDCDVERVVWLGGTLLNVGIRLGPAEESVPFEVNVAETSPTGSTEEI
jgi:hypothetical protein